ncbi:MULTISPECIES: hypothetical protein [unclassified Paenibacillus]|uniref:hypothetical protein n=1 Tax=unclassified Paenibacillus TaxID=185978 RepID=UPI0036310966
MSLTSTKKWANSYEKININNPAALKWIVNKIISVLAICHFNNMMRISSIYSNQKYSSYYKDYHYQGLPNFGILLSGGEIEQLRFFIDGTCKIYDPGLKCPKYKENRKEIFHHHMNLALLKMECKDADMKKEIANEMKYVENYIKSISFRRGY